METQLSAAVTRNDLLSNVKRWGGSALASWRSISGSDLEFVATPSKHRHASQCPTSGDTLVRSAGGQNGAGDGAFAPSAKAGGELDKDEFTETMEVMYGALGAEDVDLALAAACAERLLELVGEDEEMDEDDGLEGTSLTRLELAGACHDKVTATVRQAFADLAAVGAPELKRGVSTGNKVQAGLSFDDGIKKALSLWSVAQKMEVEEEAVECLKALVQRQVKSEAGSRLEKIRAGVRLAESIRPGGGIDTTTGMMRVSKEGASVVEWLAAGGGVLKGEDPLYISSLTAILNLAASLLALLQDKLGGERSQDGADREEHLPELYHCVLMQTCESSRQLISQYRADRNAAGLAKSARDGKQEEKAALGAAFQRLDLLLGVHDTAVQGHPLVALAIHNGLASLNVVSVRALSFRVPSHPQSLHRSLPPSPAPSSSCAPASWTNGINTGR